MYLWGVMMNAVSADEERAHGWQIALAAAAVLALLPWMALGVESVFVPIVVMVGGLPVAIPLRDLRRREAFVRSCIGAASYCAFCAICGFMFGAFVLLPSAVLLLLAAGADPRRRPDEAPVLGVVGALLAAGAVVGPTVLIWDVVVAP